MFLGVVDAKGIIRLKMYLGKLKDSQSEIVTRKKSQPCAFSIWNMHMDSWAMREKMEKGHDQAHVFGLTNLFECLTCRQNGRGTWFYQRWMSYTLESFQKLLSGIINVCDMLGKSQCGFCRPILSYVTPLVLGRCFQVHGRDDQVGWSSGPHWNISAQGIKEKSIMD